MADSWALVSNADARVGAPPAQSDEAQSGGMAGQEEVGSGSPLLPQVLNADHLQERLDEAPRDEGAFECLIQPWFNCPDADH